LGGAPVAGLGDVLFHHQAAGGHIRGLDVLRVGADIADMRKGEADDLAGVGRVGQGFLVAGHAGVEAELAHSPRGVSAEAAAPEDGAVRQHQGGVGAGGGRAWGLGLEIRERQAGGGDDRAPVLGGNGARLAPFANGVQGDAGQARGVFRAAEAVQDVVYGDHEMAL